LSSKIVSVEEAILKIKDNSTVAIGSSGGGFLEPALLLKSLGERYKKTAEPKNLTLLHSTGIGDNKDGGLCHLALKGLVKRDIGGHWGMAPKMVELALNNDIEAYNLPQGVLSQLFREIAANRPGLITKVGLRTFIDPRIEGGKLNSVTTEDIVNLIELNGEEFLFYPVIKIDVALIRGTTADLDGNITLEKEGTFLENLSIAQAAHNSSGIVIAQVERIAQRGALNPQNVKIPGILVDYIVVDKKQQQTCITHYNPGYSGEIKVPVESLKPMPLNHRKIIARRATEELKKNCVINLGVGIADGVALVAAEEGIENQFTFVVEQGLIGGVPAPGVEFGASLNPIAIIDAPYQFDFFDGGGVDVAFLGAAEIDRHGNVNVSKFGSHIAGCGGFINISQNAKKVVFCCTFTTGGLKIKIEDGKLNIIQEGKIKKFVKDVEQITFSGEHARQINNQKILYITERAVFRLNSTGLKLIEVAPGVDIENDILNLMDFEVEIADKIHKMDSKIFNANLMNLKIS